MSLQLQRIGLLVIYTACRVQLIMYFRIAFGIPQGIQGVTRYENLLIENKKYSMDSNASEIEYQI